MISLFLQGKGEGILYTSGAARVSESVCISEGTRRARNFSLKIPKNVSQEKETN
jgi:hypothetical protein